MRTTTGPISPKATRNAWWRRLVTAGTALTLSLGATLFASSPASATVRMANGAYGSYGLDCTGYHSARLTVQGGANGIPVNYFKYWVWSVDRAQYVVNGALVSNGPGWNATTVTVAQAPGRYQILVEYWSYSNGGWYTGSEWTWATNLVQPTSSQICRVV